MLSRKNEAHKKLTERSTRTKKEKYDDLRRVANRTIRRKKREYFDEKLINE